MSRNEGDLARSTSQIDTAATSVNLVELRVAELHAGDLQVRVNGLDEGYLRVLAQLPDRLPPVTVVRTGDRWLLVDGHHTLAVAQAAGHATVSARVIEAPEDGDLYGLAFAANARHGLPLTLADRRAYATHLLRKAPESSNMEVGRRAGLSPSTVAAIRERLEAEEDLPASDRQVRRGEATYTYPATVRERGQLPDEPAGTGLVDAFVGALGSAERRSQRRLARYVDRLLVALGDRTSIEGWTQVGTAAAGLVAVHGPERALNVAAKLREAATDLTRLAEAAATAAAGASRS